MAARTDDPAAPSRVAIVDDHEIVSLSIGALLAEEPDLEFAGAWPSAVELVRDGAVADLVVMDLNLRDGSLPSENVDRIRETGAVVVVLTSGENPFLIRDVSHAGVLGILRKSAPAEEILAAVRAAAAGVPAVTTEWAAAIDSDPEFSAAPLTAREREVLGLYASGLGAKAVASRLYISENTVDDHIRRIRSLYEGMRRPARTKVELYQRGIEDGFIPPPASH